MHEAAIPPLSKRTATEQVSLLRSIGDHEAADALSAFMSDSAVQTVLFHGTTHDFDSFDPNRGFIDGHYGGDGVYLTTSAEDASINYAGRGPDLNGRIEVRTGELINEWNEEGAPDELVDRWDDLDYDEKWDLATERAIDELDGGHDNVMPVFVRVTNPVVVTPGGGTVFKVEFPGSSELTHKLNDLYRRLHDNRSLRRELPEDDPQSELLRIEYGELSDQIAECETELEEQRRNDTPIGTGARLLEIAEEVAEQYELVEMHSVTTELLDLLVDEATAYDVELHLRSALSDAINANGDTVVAQAIAEIWERLGYDAIIQDAYFQFGKARPYNGKPMEGLQYGDLHVIVFDPRRIKSATGCRTFDLNCYSITDADRPLQEDVALVERRPRLYRAADLLLSGEALEPGDRMREPLDLELVDGQLAPALDDDAWLYHVTSMPNARRIVAEGFLMGQGSIASRGGGYAAHSKGKVFFTERSGVYFWQSRVEDHLFDQFDDPPEVGVVRVPRDQLVAMLEPDDLGTQDANATAYSVATDLLAGRVPGIRQAELDERPVRRAPMMR